MIRGLCQFYSWWSMRWGALLVAAAVATVSAGSLKAETEPSLTELPADSLLPESLVPRQPRQEAIEDQILASALFTQGRLCFRREQFEAALQRYQRAFRYANGSTTILSEIIPLAFRLDRLDEAARYALQVKEPLDVDPFILRRIALQLTEQFQFADALRLYQLAGKSPNDQAEIVPTVITQFEIGRLMYLTDRFQDALVPFEEVRKMLALADPPGPEKPAVDALLEERQVTYALMAETYLKADRPADADELYRLAYQTQPDAAVLQFYLASVAAAEKDFEKALDHLRRYLQTGDTAAGTAPFELLAQLLAQTKQSDRLLDELETLATQQDQNVFLIYYLGEEYLKRHQPAQAVDRFQQLMRVQPLIDGYRGLMRARMQQQDASTLLRLLAEGVVQPGGAESLEGVMDELIADPPLLDRVIRVARDEFLSEQATQPKPLQRAVALTLAEILTRKGDAAAADELYARAAGQGDEADSSVWLTWGLHRLTGLQPGSAVEVFQELCDQVDDAQQRAPLEFYLSAALALDRRYDEALTVAERAAEQLPDVPAIQSRPAWILSLAQRLPAAAAAYREFLDRFGGDFQSSAVREVVREAKTSLSSICVLMEQYAEAEEWLEQVLDEFPKDVGAHNDLGYLWADRGVHLQRALTMTQFACEQEPDNVAYRDSLGWVLFRLGKCSEAVAELRKATDVESPDGVILDHLGDALHGLKDFDAAVAAWERALQSWGDESPKQRAAVQAKIDAVSGS